VTLTVRLSARARSDLGEIWRYSAGEWGVPKANDYIRSIDAAIRLVAENPELARDAGAVRPGLLKFLAGSHMVFFRVHQRRLNVVRILHQRMDYARHI
jgi:toxin ParE1/3/4